MHSVIVLVSRMQKSGTGNIIKNFCQMERDILIQPTEMTRPVKVFQVNIPVKPTKLKCFNSIWLYKKKIQNFRLNGKHPGSLPLLYKFQNSKASEPSPRNKQYLTSQIRSDNPGLQSRSHRRGVTPLVLFWNLSGYIS